MTVKRTILADAALPFSETQWTQLRQAAAPDEIEIVPNGAYGQVLPRAEIAWLSGDLDGRFFEPGPLKWVHCNHAGLTHWGAGNRSSCRTDRSGLRSARPKIIFGRFATGTP